jgi:membrane-bound lytic murein transglycosylase MltF
MNRKSSAMPGWRNPVRSLAVILWLGWALFAFGCSPGKAPSGTSSDKTGEAHPAAADSELAYTVDPVSPELLAGAAEPWTGDFEGMVKRRVIRVLVVYNKTHYFFDGLRPRGISYDALVEFERVLNKSLRTRHLKVHVIHIPVSRDSLLPMLVSGRGDLAVGNVTITPERAKKVAFSIPLATNVSEVVVTHASGPALSSLEDLGGREVWVRPSSSYFESLVALNQRFRREGRDTIVIRRADEHFETEDLLELTAAGVIDITIADDHLASFWADVFDSLKVHRELAVRREAELGWAFRKDSPAFEKKVNAFLLKHRVGNYTGNVLLTQYLKTNKWARNPDSGVERLRFSSTAALFKRYAAQYDFDWLMIAAQAYQESKLDQKLVSPAGAVGVMQVLPSTAADPNVNIRNVRNVENNIHAGVKYMRFIRDRYLSDAPMTELDRHLFAFASYNAGPNRIASMRRRAAARGYDPNVWFQNVEILAAKEIGRETVQYVSNIFKYYVAYKLALEKELQPKVAVAPPAP